MSRPYRHLSDKALTEYGNQLVGILWTCKRNNDGCMNWGRKRELRRVNRELDRRVSK